MTRNHRPQSGTILICVLTCLLIVSGLAVAMVKSALTARKAVRTELKQAQTQFVLEAGIQRAVDKLSRDPDYQGETWDLPAEALNDVAPASVEITVKTPADDPSPTVSVVAQYPADSPLSIRRSHTFTFSNEE
jgi:type II secretory pathway component PulK